MGVKVQFNGLAEFKAALRNLPEELAGEAAHVVEASANGAALEVKRAYPVHTGNLVAGVHVTHFDQGKVAAGAVLKSAARHAHLFEFGTKGRRTKQGWNRGAMPKPPNQERMIPIVQRARRRMYSGIAEILRRAGFEVNGI